MPRLGCHIDHYQANDQVPVYAIRRGHVGSFSPKGPQLSPCLSQIRHATAQGMGGSILSALFVCESSFVQTINEIDISGPHLQHCLALLIARLQKRSLMYTRSYFWNDVEVDCLTVILCIVLPLKIHPGSTPS